MREAKSFRSIVGICLSVVIASTLAGCGGSSQTSPSVQLTPPSSQSEYLYSTSTGGITAFSVDSLTGKLGSGTLATSSSTSLAFLANMVSDPAGKFLFVCDLGNSSVVGDIPASGTGILLLAVSLHRIGLAVLGIVEDADAGRQNTDRGLTADPDGGGAMMRLCGRRECNSDVSTVESAVSGAA